MWWHVAGVEMNRPLPSCSRSRLGGLVRDLTAGLKQQMFFWGKDVVYPLGNLLLRQGFEKRPSTGLQGTSCYCLPWRGGWIELHGACAGWYSDGGDGFVFIRPLGKCHLWRARGAPVPGEWKPGLAGTTDPILLREGGLPFFEWWLASEKWISREGGKNYRDASYRHFKRLPQSRPWLPPSAAAEWLSGFIHDPDTLERAKRRERRSGR